MQLFLSNHLSMLSAHSRNTINICKKGKMILVVSISIHPNWDAYDGGGPTWYIELHV